MGSGRYLRSVKHGVRGFNGKQTTREGRVFEEMEKGCNNEDKLKKKIMPLVDTRVRVYDSERILEKKSRGEVPDISTNKSKEVHHPFPRCMYERPYVIAPYELYLYNSWRVQSLQASCG